MTLDPPRSDDRDGSVNDRRSFLLKAAVAPAVALGASILPLTGALRTAVAADEDDAGRPDPELGLVAFIISVEYALVELYSRALSSGKLSSTNSELAEMFAAHHNNHAERFATLLDAAGAEIPQAGNEGLLDSYKPQIDGAAEEADVLGLLAELEDALAATQLASLQNVSSAAISGAVGAILPVEAQHVAVLSAAANPELLDDPAGLTVKLQDDDNKLDESQYPVGSSEDVESSDDASEDAEDQDTAEEQS